MSWFDGLSPPWQAAVGLLLLLLASGLLQLLAQAVLTHMVTRLRTALDRGWARVLWHDRVLARMAAVVPSLVVQIGVAAVPHLSVSLAAVVRNVAVAVTILQLLRMLTTLLDVLLQAHEEKESSASSARSIKSYVQLAQLALILLGAIVIIAALVDRSPLILLSGLGAMSAVLMLVFKDTILSFTAGVQLASNDMLRVGDWIEMPQLAADGTVVDIALHTVKVQNFDKSITTIPTWRLMSESFRNWRGMVDSGGRRIRRALRLDAQTVRFLDDADVERLSRIALLRPYLEDKLQHLQQANAATRERLRQQWGEDAPVAPANLRRLTNIGTLRAYIQAYLEAHPRIRQDMPLMVRQLESSPQGIPLDLYCFTTTTAWVEYEGIQADLFDHLLAVLPEFGLRLYQNPSGGDLRDALGALKG